MHLLHVVLLAWLGVVSPEVAPAPQINPVPRTMLTEKLLQWSFKEDEQGWTAEHDCTVASADGLLKIRCTGNDPYLHRKLDVPGGSLLLHITARGRTGGSGGIYWTTDKSPHRGEDKKAAFRMTHDGQWHDYSVPFAADGRLTDLRIDPGEAAGEVDIGSIRLDRAEPHPLTIERIDVLPDRVRVVVKNHRPQPLAFSSAGREHRIEAGATIHVERPTSAKQPLDVVTVELTAKDLPPVRRTIFLHHEETPGDWIALPSPLPSPSGRGDQEEPSPKGRGGEVTILVARDGSVARIKRDGALVAVLAPIVHCDGRLPALKLVDSGPTVRFQGDGVSLSVALAGAEMSISIQSRRPCEGPVVRALGRMEQGLFAGLEYLENNEASSSTLDIETEEHLRFAPDPLKVTLPLMALVTDRASLAMTWTDMALQPVFATPNFFDGTADHRMALRGTRIRATIRVAVGPTSSRQPVEPTSSRQPVEPTSSRPLEETILWAVKKLRLPPLPDPPRSVDEQWKLCLKALGGPLKGEAGWGHCADANFPRRPYADHASTIWRLTGDAPKLPQLTPGGAHVPNGSIYFVTGRAKQWLDWQSQHVAGILRGQQPDGSFRYGGPYRRGHFEDTANGVCARPAAELLEYARITGNRAALEAAVRTLEYMKRFRTPRGAQVWEIPLHTPDQLASAYAVWAYVRGYELTGNKEYLAEARRWALSGVPFVYLWSRYPIMLYGTPPVFGATNWQAPNWMGLPVQWVGGVYAYALAMLAPYDDSLDWKHLARGILIAAEQMQYPDGENVGLLPDVFELSSQQRRPARINPCAVVSLRLVLDGQVDFLSVAADARHRVAAPLPVSIRDGKAQIRGKAGVAYQALIDGRRIVDVTSQGDDVVPLDN